MQVRTQTVGAAGVIQLGAGTFFRLFSCPNPVDIVFNKDASPIGEALQVGTGFAWVSRDENGKLKPFTSLKITSAAAQTIQFGFGYGELFLDLATGTVSITKAGTLATLADVALTSNATTQILAASTSRRRAFISNLVANLKTFRIGDASAGAARGVPLAPGETITIETTASIQGFSPAGGATESVAVMTEGD